MSVRLLIAAAALLPLGTLHAQAAPKAAPTVNYPGVSPAGNAVLTKLLRQDDVALKQIIVQMRDAQAALQLEVQRPAIDVDKVAVLLKRAEVLQGQFRAHNNDRLIAALRALPAADRAPFLKIVGARPQAAAAPAR